MILIAAVLMFAQPPGAVDSSVTQANIDSTICVKGYTKSVRPPARYTNRLKLQQLAGRGDPHEYEEDHLVPLELGGHPTSPQNLWPEAWEGPHGAHVKDRLENRLHAMVCARQISLHEAQRAIVDWENSYSRYMGEAP